MALTSDIDLLVEFNDHKKLQSVCRKICFENKNFKISKNVYKSKILKKDKITQLVITLSKKNNSIYFSNLNSIYLFPKKMNLKI